MNEKFENHKSLKNIVKSTSLKILILKIFWRMKLNFKFQMFRLQCWLQILLQILLIGKIFFHIFAWFMNTVQLNANSPINNTGIPRFTLYRAFLNLKQKPIKTENKLLVNRKFVNLWYGEFVKNLYSYTHKTISSCIFCLSKWKIRKQSCKFDTYTFMF